MTDIIVQNGFYAKKRIRNQRFKMELSPRMGVKGMYVTVEGAPLGYPGRKIRVMVEKEGDVRLVKQDDAPIQDMPVETVPLVLAEPKVAEPKVAEPEEHREDDEVLMARMRKKFQIMDGMTLAAVQGGVRAMIVTGPPGVGKSFGIEAVINSLDVMVKMGLIPEDSVDLEAKMAMEKVSFASPLGLYQLLYRYSKPGSLLVLDDSDSILFDETCLNMLKAATDSGKKRRLSWRTESRVLYEADIPDEFEFEGAVIFITNLDFENTRGKIGEHLKAIVSRCHYIDVGISTAHEKFLRCKQIIRDGMLEEYKFTDSQINDIIEYLETHKLKMRELSLRMVKKVADLVKMDPDTWQDYANETCLRGRK
jgi:hypothetical protein